MNYMRHGFRHLRVPCLPALTMLLLLFAGCENSWEDQPEPAGARSQPDRGGRSSTLGAAMDAAERTVDALEQRDANIGRQIDAQND